MFYSQVNAMSRVCFNVKVAPGFEADATVGNDIFELKHDTREVGRLRGTLWELAQVAAANPKKRVVLVLVNPAVSKATIAAAWHSLRVLLRPDLARRLAIWMIWETDFQGHPEKPTDHEIKLIQEILESPNFTERSRGPTHGDSLSEVLRLLLYKWLLDEGPMTLTAIGGLLGYTFKPVRAALDALERYLELYGKRGVKLAAFPREPWARLVHNPRSVRGTLHFSCRAGSNRSAESLLQRFRRLGLPQVAVGGVAGTRHYHSELDLLGVPRLDLCIHQRSADPDLTFIRALDPGLVQERYGEPGPLAIHFLYRKVSLFDHGWADPVECLLDLHEMRLESQALQLLRSFPNARKASF